MLSTLIDRLGTLLSGNFIIAAFMPTLSFVFVNLALVYLSVARFRVWLDPQLATLQTTFQLIVVLLVTAILAYIFSSISQFLRETLEGKHLNEGAWIRRVPALYSLFRALERSQREKWLELKQERDEARIQNGKIARAEADWAGRLSYAAEEGLRLYPGCCRYSATSNAAKEIEHLRNFESDAEPLMFETLEAAVERFEAVLRKNDRTMSERPSEDLRRLDGHNRALHAIVAGTKRAWKAKENDAWNELQIRFGSTLELTTLGNVGAALKDYAMVRYQFDLGTFLTRFLNIVQTKDPNLYKNVLGAKAQLDFFILAWWLWLMTTAGWFIAYAVAGYSLVLFACVAVFGMAACVGAYYGAVENYRAFSDSVRTMIDLYRFDLLAAERVGGPKDLAEERAAWENLQNLSYGRPELNFEYSDLK